MSQLKRISIGAAAAAIVVETGARNLLVWTLVTVGTPVTTAAIVYEIVQMRQSRLQREGTNPPAAAQDGATSNGAELESRAQRVSYPEIDLRRSLTSMLIAHAHFVDIYGANPESVSPTGKRLAFDMLEGDYRMFARLQAEKQKDLDGYLFDLQQDEARLRVLHAQVAALTSGTPAPPTRGKRAVANP